MVTQLVFASRFLAGNMEAELKPTPFSLFILFTNFASQIKFYYFNIVIIIIKQAAFKALYRWECGGREKNKNKN